MAAGRARPLSKDEIIGGKLQHTFTDDEVSAVIANAVFAPPKKGKGN
jgi:hypothetical protein